MERVGADNSVFRFAPPLPTIYFVRPVAENGFFCFLADIFPDYITLTLIKFSPPLVAVMIGLA